MHRITLEQLRKAGPESQRLYELAQKQLEEHKVWLRRELLRWYEKEGKDVISPQTMTSLVTAAHMLRLSLSQKEGSLREMDGRQTVSVVYEYPDELYDFLNSPQCPSELSPALAGGMELTVEPDKVA